MKKTHTDKQHRVVAGAPIAGLSTVGDQAFLVASARTWNSLPQHVIVTSATAVSVSEVASRLSSSDVPSLHCNF